MPGSVGACGEVLCEREVTRRRPALLSGRRIWPARLRHWLARSRRRQNRYRIAENGVFSRADEQPTHCKARRAFHLTPQVCRTLHLAAASGPNPTRLPTGPTHSRPEPTAPGPRVAPRPVNRQHAFEGSRPCDQFRSRSCARVRIGAQAWAGRPPPASTSTSRRRRRASTHSAQHRLRTSTALPARALFIYPGRIPSARGAAGALAV